MNILVTGGLGYIGSHTIIKLLSDGHNIIVIDNLSNSQKNILDKIAIISKLDKRNRSRLNFEKGDIRIKDNINKIFNNYKKKNLKIEAVIHFAGLKSVNESIINPSLYWEVNVMGTFNLLDVMNKNNCKIIIFSSSCTVYGDSHKKPIEENNLKNPCNPYGFSKLAVEMYLQSIAKCNDFNSSIKETHDDWKIGILRYFNPLGAHKSGIIGENPKGIPNNILPLITKVAINELEKIIIFGKDYPTRDGTAIRDYIHVMDLANGHASTLNYLLVNDPQLLTLNLGTGKGTSVLELINTFSEVNNVKINFEYGQRRKGDAIIAVANPNLSKNILGWEPRFNINDMCIDSWRWQQNLSSKN